MFEKKAEDSFKCKKVLYKWETDKHSYIDGFKDGVEFGYNKANEWHFVKDESYTKSWKKYNKYLVIIRLPVEVGNSDIPLLAYFDHYHQKWSVDRKCLSAYNVIAWKEMILPKEIELNSF